MTPPVWKELFDRFTERIFRKRLSICVYASFHFGFEVGVWDLIFIFFLAVNSMHTGI